MASTPHDSSVVFSRQPLDVRLSHHGADGKPSDGCFIGNPVDEVKGLCFFRLVPLKYPMF